MAQKIETASTKGKRQILTAVKSTETKSGSEPVSAEARRQMIAESAYFRAERRGLRMHGNENEDWYEAEKEVDEILGGSKLKKRKSNSTHSPA